MLIHLGVLFSNDEIQEALRLGKSQQEDVQCLFNQGKYVYQSKIVHYDDTHIYFDFDGIEESTLISIIDFYSPVVFVFFNDGLRFQFLARKSQLVTYNGQTTLQIAVPSNINVVEGRKTPRIEFPEGFAVFETELQQHGTIQLPVREMSMGGFSVWSHSSFGLTPHASLRSCQINFSSGFKIKAGIEIVRINFSLGNPPSKTNIISCRFTQINERDALGLQKQLVQIKELTANP